MATADTEAQKPGSRRRRHQPSRTEHDFLPADAVPPARPPPLSRSQSHRERPTKQLDFYQAMSDFKAMFPTMDSDVIEAVLRSNDGAVDDTIDQLLTMSIDTEDPLAIIDVPPELLSPVNDPCPSYNEARSEDSPPSYSEAVQSQKSKPASPHADDVDHGTSSIWTTPIASQEKSLKPSIKLSPSRKKSPSSRSPSSTERKSSSHGESRSSHHHHHHRGRHRRHRSKTEDQIDELAMSNTEIKRPISLTNMSLPAPLQSVTSKKGYRNWNPPMLGALPDDFLRLTVPTKPFTHTPEKLDWSSWPSPYHHGGMAGPELLPRSHNISRKDRHSEKQSRSHSEKKKLSRSVSERSNGHGALRNMDRLPLVHSHTARHDTSPGLPKSLIISTHEFSQDMLDEKMKENERRRRKAVKNVDLEMSQYLEDERLAIMLQNTEFLEELRGNEDFMKTLEKDRMNLSAFEPILPSPIVESPPVVEPPPINKEQDGYGRDKQEHLDAFPFSQPLPPNKDEDAELRRQLKNMGGASKKQFMALAKKFFSRRKKKNSLKYIQKEKLAPSMVNLLDSDEEDYDPEPDLPYNQDTEIEPLPDNLTAVPSHRTVQRPMYHVDTVTSYHDNKATTDMV
ncbi:hypothetical protein FSP39_022547 [Pinctada imbricata]|uniref:CUE domain-containing protein n=1 Tax=Pinctada imbricata TaxID=66713 RepID=A0AA88XGQ4_PINIB|nr:hypothetical protein FSP39_022547 [Pinctada imbricata]